MSQAIRDLESLVPRDPSAVSAFLTNQTFPIIEGATATFVWQGQADEGITCMRHRFYK